MQRVTLGLAILAIVVTISQYASSQQEAPAPVPVVPAAPAGLLDVLQPGQIVGLEQVQDSYRVTVNPRWRTRSIYTVVAASSEGLILETQNKDTQLRVPVYSIFEVVISAVGVRE